MNARSIKRMAVTGCCLLFMSASIFIYQGLVMRKAPDSVEPPAPMPAATPPKTWTQWLDSDSPAFTSAYFIQNLSKEERALCNGLYYGITEFTEKIEFLEPIHKDVLSDLMWLIKYDCPELFHISGEYTYYVRPDDPDMVIYISPVYWMTKAEYKSALSRTEALIDGWKYQAEGMDAFATQKFIYDNLMEICEYQEYGEHTGTAYGALILGRARCEGYAQALNYALRRAGMDSVILTGEARESRVENDEGERERFERHAWNAAKIGGNFYQLDATWDDSDGALPILSAYAYYNVTDEEMSRSRRLDTIYDKLELPVSISMDYNYFVQEGAYIGAEQSVQDSFLAMLDAMYEQSGSDVLLKLANEAQFYELNEGLRDWMGTWGAMKGYTSGTYSLTTYPDSRVFCLTQINFE